MEFYICRRGASKNGTFEVPSTSSKKGLMHKITVQNGVITCSCVGFKTHRKCKHCDKFKSSCGWNQFIDGGNPNKNLEGHLICPKCGGNVEDSGI